MRIVRMVDAATTKVTPVTCDCGVANIQIALVGANPIAVIVANKAVCNRRMAMVIRRDTGAHVSGDVAIGQRSLAVFVQADAAIAAVARDLRILNQQASSTTARYSDTSRGVPVFHDGASIHVQACAVEPVVVLENDAFGVIRDGAVFQRRIAIGESDPCVVLTTANQTVANTRAALTTDDPTTAIRRDRAMGDCGTAVFAVHSPYGVY